MPKNKINLKLVFVIFVCLVGGGVGSAFAAEKPHIGVLRFTNHTHAYWWSVSTATELQDMLVSELSATKTFHVLDRQELYSLLEQKFTESLLPDTKTKPKAGKARATRYLLLATLSAFEENTNVSDNETKFINRFFSGEPKKASLVIDVKLIDSDTGLIADSRSLEATSAGSASQNGHTGNVSRFCGNLSKQEKTMVGNAIRNAVAEIAKYLECFLITKDEECMKKYSITGTKRKEKTNQ